MEHSFNPPEFIKQDYTWDSETNTQILQSSAAFSSNETLKHVRPLNVRGYFGADATIPKDTPICFEIPIPPPFIYSTRNDKTVILRAVWFWSLNEQQQQTITSGITAEGEQQPSEISNQTTTSNQTTEYKYLSATETTHYDPLVVNMVIAQTMLICAPANGQIPFNDYYAKPFGAYVLPSEAGEDKTRVRYTLRRYLGTFATQSDPTTAFSIIQTPSLALEVDLDELHIAQTAKYIDANNTKQDTDNVIPVDAYGRTKDSTNPETFNNMANATHYFTVKTNGTKYYAWTPWFFDAAVRYISSDGQKYDEQTTTQTTTALKQETITTTTSKGLSLTTCPVISTLTAQTSSAGDTVMMSNTPSDHPVIFSSSQLPSFLVAFAKPTGELYTIPEEIKLSDLNKYARVYVEMTLAY